MTVRGSTDRQNVPLAGGPPPVGIRWRNGGQQRRGPQTWEVVDDDAVGGLKAALLRDTTRPGRRGSKPFPARRRTG